MSTWTTSICLYPAESAAHSCWTLILKYPVTPNVNLFVGDDPCIPQTSYDSVHDPYDPDPNVTEAALAIDRFAFK